uniref:Palmitoyltransferase n=1 Tax=Rhabditophanes sp. KR3021 TaxID=114890 RepID=A0AC35TXA7_9BILA
MAEIDTVLLKYTGPPKMYSNIQFLSNNWPKCRTCNSYKPPGTHHCSMCDNCILKMDHHCVWINQCVGDRSHRFFLLFMVSVWIGCCTIVCLGTNTFWNHACLFDCTNTFCQKGLELNYLPWYQFLCSGGNTFTILFVLVVYMLAVMLLIL